MRKIIHQTWKDSNPPPEIYDPSWISSWKQHHSTWEYKLWTDNELEELTSRYLPESLEWFRSVKGVVRADFGRYLILWVHGGLYADLDYECLRPFDKFLSDDLFLSWEGPDKLAVNVALMGSEPGQKIFRHACLECVRGWDSARAPKQIHLMTGPGMFTTISKGLHLRVRDCDRFCYLDWRQGEALCSGKIQRYEIPALKQQALEAGCFSITYWTGNWDHEY